LGDVSIPRGNAPATLDVSRVMDIGVRPEMLTIAFDGQDGFEKTAEGTVLSTLYYGDMTYYDVRLAQTDATVTISMRNTAGRSVMAAGSIVTVGWGADSIVLFN
jgi:ABC-type spermidine/putrescine transport systems, ATPase components